MLRFDCRLPWPPSNNMYYRRAGNKTHISDEGEKYLKNVQAALGPRARGERMTGRLRVRLGFWQPNRRRRDLDNLPKAVLDCLHKCNVIKDDSQVDQLFLFFDGLDKPNGHVMVAVETIE